MGGKKKGGGGLVGVGVYPVKSYRLFVISLSFFVHLRDQALAPKKKKKKWKKKVVENGEGARLRNRMVGISMYIQRKNKGGKFACYVSPHGGIV